MNELNYSGAVCPCEGPQKAGGGRSGQEVVLLATLRGPTAPTNPWLPPESQMHLSLYFLEGLDSLLGWGV